MPLPLTVSCFSKIQIGFTFLVPAHLGSPGKRAVKRECVEQAGSMKLSSDRLSVCLSARAIIRPPLLWARQPGVLRSQLT